MVLVRARDVGPQAVHKEVQMEPEHFEMWIRCFNRSLSTFSAEI